MGIVSVSGSFVRRYVEALPVPFPARPRPDRDGAALLYYAGRHFFNARPRAAHLTISTEQGASFAMFCDVLPQIRPKIFECPMKPIIRRSNP